MGQDGEYERKPRQAIRGTVVLSERVPVTAAVRRAMSGVHAHALRIRSIYFDMD